MNPLLLGLSCLLALGACNSQVQKKESPKPNILLIISEDNGPDLGCYGNKSVHTPVLDSLVNSGVKFENAFVTYSVCSPSRSTIFTGLYPHQNGQIGLATHKYRMHQDFKTLPVYLKEEGYRTGCLGKIHVNPESAIPFDYWGIRSANFAKKKLFRYAQYAKKFATESDEPFFLMVNFPDAHFPVQKQVEGLPTTVVEQSDIESSLPYVGITSDRLKEYTANYYNCMNRLDESVGMLMDSLRTTGKLDNTIIIYMGDHGAQFSRGKCSNYEGALKVPLAVSWPNKVKAGQVKSELISSIDLLPSILDAAGISKPDSLPGVSYLPLCTGNKSYEKRNYVFADGEGSAPFFFFPRRSARGKRFKLIHNLVRRENPHVKFYQAQQGHFAGGTSLAEMVLADSLWTKTYQTWTLPPVYELYDLENDPLETTNLSLNPDFKDELVLLQRTLEKWQIKTADPLKDPLKLKQLTQEMDSVVKLYPNHEYRKKTVDFEWEYPNYLYKKTNLK